MLMKFVLNLLLLLSFYPSFFYSSHKKLKHAKSIDGASLFFPSNDIKLANVSGRELARMQDLRLKSLSEAVYDSSAVPVAKDFYTSALAAEIDEKFDKSDRFAAQGYRAMLDSQPYGRLLEQEDSLVYNLWNLLNRCSLGNNTVSLIKSALWQEVQRDLAQKQHITYEDISLLDQISNAYLNSRLPLQEASSLQHINDIVDEVKQSEAQAREQERLQRLEEERIRLQEQERLQRLEEERARAIEEEHRQLREEELKRRQQEEKIKRFGQERLLISDRFKQSIRNFVMKYDGEIDHENRSRFNFSLYSCFFAEALYKDRYFAGDRNKKIGMENIGQNIFFDRLVAFLDHHYPPMHQSVQPSKGVSTREEGEMEIKSDSEYIRRKGYLILSRVPELIPYLVDLPRSDLDQNVYRVHVLRGTTRNGDSIECVILPKCDLLFYQIERFVELGSTNTSENDSFAISSENLSSNSSSVLSASAASASSYSVPPLPAWRIPESI